MPVLTASRLKPTIPSGLPVTSPSAIPQAMRLESNPLIAPAENVTPTFDSANSGSTTNDTQSFSLRVALGRSFCRVQQRLETSKQAICGCQIAFRLSCAETPNHVGADFLKLVER